MIDIKLIEQKIELETELKDAKLWLAQKELVSYNVYKEANPTSREAMDKVVSRLKLEDDSWLEKEADLITKEVMYKKVALIVDVLNNTLNAMSRHSDISKSYLHTACRPPEICRKPYGGRWRRTCPGRRCG